MQHLAPKVRGDFIATVVRPDELVLVDTQGVNQRRVEIADGNRAFDGGVAEFVGGSDGLPTFDAATGRQTV